MHIRFQNNLLQDGVQIDSQLNENKWSSKDLASITQFKNSLITYSNKSPGVSSISKLSKQEKQKHSKEHFTLDPNIIKLSKNSNSKV